MTQVKVVAKDKLIIVICTYEQRYIAKLIGASWSKQKKRWYITPSFSAYLKLTKFKNITIDQPIINYYNQDKFKIEKILTKKLNFNKFSLKTDLFPHQKYILNQLVTKYNFLLYLGVGTGKTKITIDWFSILFQQKKIKKCLVVCPKSIMYNFSDEIKMHSDFSVSVISGNLKERKRKIEEEAHFHIINYDNLKTITAVIIKKKYDMVIFDEFHYCKNRNSIRSKKSLKIANKINYKIGLTGTAICNSFKDIFMLNQIIDPAIFGRSFTKFFYKYNEEQNKEEFKKLIGINSFKLELRDIVDLPEEIIIKKIFSLPSKSMEIYKTLKNKMIIFDNEKKIPVQNILSRTIKLNQIASGFMKFKDENENEILNELDNTKLDLLLDIIDQIESKIIIICRFTHSIDKIAEALNSKNISHLIYDGRTKNNTIYTTFNTDDTKVFIAQIQKGEGYSIPNAKYMIFYELDYSRKNHIQCKGRNLRLIGSEKGSCVYMYLMAKNTIDEFIYETLLKKDFTSVDAMEYIETIVKDSD